MTTAAEPVFTSGASVTRPVVLHGEAFWRSLFYFNAYRVIGAVLLLVMATAWSDTLPFGSRNYRLFVAVTGCYLLLSLLYFALIRLRWRFDAQLTVQVMSDIAAIAVLTYASGGVSSGLGLLLLTILAAAGLIARGRLTLFYAALASIALLLEHTYDVLHNDVAVAQYAHAGLLSATYFMVAWVAHVLAKYALASEERAAQREIDFENMAQVSEHVIQDLQDGVLVVDGRGVIRQFNVSAERIMGPLRGRDVPLDEYAPDLARRFAAWQQDEHGRDMPGEVELTRTLGARFVPVGRGRIAGSVIFLEDRTRIQAEARQMKLAALGRLTANIAHEVRNPLGAISHAAELLQEEPEVSETARRLITIIQDNTQRLDRMVNDVLKLRRGDTAHRESFRLSDYLRTFVEQFCQIEKLDPGVFKLDLHVDPTVVFDRSHLNQVMWNLCRNAIRHCRREKGSIRLIVTPQPGVSAVKLDVVDDGPGVPSELRSQLFEPFFTTARGGTGLGLYIAREVCEVNNARLDYVETAEGARFSVLCRTA
ncbi:MAG TPA: HAMP domain-containing sensor histidine kinase [Burkholderiales bacterium]|nr:HAMP domain-containing sensor histidine kinase [Burkholderiales bacterium]